MDKKKVIKWTTGILVNLAALVTIYLTANPQALPKNATKKDSLEKIAAARFVPSYSKSANPGLLSRVADDVNYELAAEQKLREMRPRVLCRQDTITNRGKVQIHLAQQVFFENRLARMKQTTSNDAYSSKSATESDWDKLNNITTTGNFSGYHRLKPDVQVFGWHPYWMGSAYKNYNYSLLSTVAYYGAEIDPVTGYITNTHGWKTSGLPTAALGDPSLGDPCRVELTVINMGEENNDDLLSDSWSRQTLVDSLTALIAKRGDGICIDFEGVPLRMRDSLTQFISALKTSLDTAAKLKMDSTMNGFFTGYSITMVLPCFDWTGAYDVKKLAPLVNRFVVIGYDYYGFFSDTTGPVAPLNSGLTWLAPNIERSVADYLKKGIPPAKLLLGLPYYGVSWQAANTKVPSASMGFLDFPAFRDIKKELVFRDNRYDTASVSAFYISKDSLPIQCWYDNKETLSEKYRWVLRNRLGGVGIWALGYDNGYPDLWESLRDNFGRDMLVQDTTYKSQFILAAHDTTALPQDKEWGIVAANGHYLIFDNPYVLLYGALGLFAVILLVQVLLDQQPFNELFSKRLLLFILSSLVGTIAIIFLGLALWSKVPHREAYLLLAGIIGGYLLFRLTQRIVGKKDKLP